MSDWQAFQQQVDAVLEKDLFFVVGCQKSGTTWLQRLLDGHPEIVCQGEGMFGPVMWPLLKQAVQAFNQKQHQRNRQLHDFTDHLALDGLHFEHLLRTAAGLLFTKWEGVDHARVVGEKTPEHALYLDTLDRLFPGMKVVHIIRDGRDAAISGWFHNLRKGEAQFRQRFPDLASYVAYFARHHWVNYIEQVRRFGRAAPQRYVELRYEDLHSDPDATIARLLSFLGLDASEPHLAACREAGDFKRLSAGRSSGTEDRTAFYRKGVVGDWREHFDESARQAFLREAGRLAEELGYCEDADAAAPPHTAAGSSGNADAG